MYRLHLNHLSAYAVCIVIFACAHVWSKLIIINATVT